VVQRCHCRCSKRDVRKCRPLYSAARFRLTPFIPILLVFGSGRSFPTSRMGSILAARSVSENFLYMPHEFVKLASLRVRGLGRIGGKVLGQKGFRPIPILQPKMAKNGRFRRVDSQQLLVRFSWIFSRLSRISSNRSYLTCNPPSCGFVEMCCCDHEASKFCMARRAPCKK
jgi:hypothetical protein